MPDTFISLGDALILSVVGFSVVLAALSVLAIFIVIMAKFDIFIAFIAKIINGKKPEEAPAPVKEEAPVVLAPVKDPNKVPLPETTSMGACDLNDVSDKDAAMIMAIVADQLKAPLNTLVFKSIKEVK